MTTGESHSRVPLWRRKAFWLGVLVVVVAPLAWFSLPSRSHFYTDAETIKEPREVARPRDILWQPPRVVDFGFSVGDDLYEPRLSADGLTLYFVRGKAGDDANGGADIVFSRRAYDGWSAPQELTSVNSDADDLGPEISADGLALYFYSNRNGGEGGYDLWVARRIDELADFSAPENLGPAVNSAYNEYGPALCADGSTLYFSSNRPRDSKATPTVAQGWSATIREDLFKRTYDLYVVTLEPDGITTANALTLLNTEANEGAPAVSPSGDFFYFSSDRPGGAGGFDLYRARRLRGTLTEVINLGPAINTSANELDPAVSLGGFALHFSSDRREADGTAPPYRLFQCMSREVFVDAEMHRAAINWGAVWSALGPNLLWALLALLMVLLLLATLRAARDRRLSLLVRCLLTSLALHALLMLLFTVWQVTAAMTGLGSRKGEIRVALSGDHDGGLHAQIRGALTGMSDASARTPAVPQVVSIEAAQGNIPIGSTLNTLAQLPEVVIPVAAILPADRQVPDADVRLVSTSRQVHMDGGALPMRMVELPTPAEGERQSDPEVRSDYQEFQDVIQSVQVAPTLAIQPSSQLTHVPTPPLRTSLDWTADGSGARLLAPFTDASAAPHRTPVTVEAMANEKIRRVVEELVPPSGGARMSESETPANAPQLVATSGSVQPQAASIPIGSTIHPLETALPSSGAESRPASVNWHGPLADAPISVTIRASKSLSEAVFKGVAPIVLPEATSRLASAPHPVDAAAREEQRQLPELTNATTMAWESPTALLPLPDVAAKSANIVAPINRSATVPLSASHFDAVARDAYPVGIAVRALPLTIYTESDLSGARPIDLPLAFDLPINAPPELPAAAEAPPRACRIQGRVVSIHTGEPIADAEVRLDVDATEPVTVRADARGRYSLAVPDELPDYFALSAMAEGYMPGSANVPARRLTSNGARVNFRLRPVTSESIAIEAVPDVHHLGDDRFAGQINSQFQKRSEGRRFSATFMVSAAQLDESADMVELRLLAKGVQTRHRLLINGQSLPERLDIAPDDGSFGEFATRFPRQLISAGENTFEIHAGSIGKDVDDFEFVNVQIHLKP